MDLNICTLVILKYHILVIILHIHKGYYHGHDTLPLHGETCSAIDEQKKLDPKDSTYNLLKCEVEKRDQR
jgi:hypothetical protein